MHAQQHGVQRLQEGKRETPLHPKAMNINRELSDEDNLGKEERCCCIGSRNNGRNLTPRMYRTTINFLHIFNCTYSTLACHFMENEVHFNLSL